MLLQNIGYIPWVIQGISEPVLPWIICTSHIPIPINPSFPSNSNNHPFALYICESVYFIVTSLLFS